MSIQNVAVVRTVIDRAVEDEIRAVAARPAAARYHIRYLAFFVPSDEAAMRTVRPSDLLERNQRQISDRLSRELADPEPDLVLIHTGLAFSFASATVLSIVSHLKDEHPNVRFAIQPGRPLDDALAEPALAQRIRQLFETSEETGDVLKAVF